MDDETRISGREPGSSSVSPDSEKNTSEERRLQWTGTNKPRRVLIVGTDETARKLADELDQSENPVYEVVGFVEDTHAQSSGGWSLLGCRDEIQRILHEQQIDEVIVSNPLNWQEQFLKEILSNGHKNLQVKVVPSVYEAMLGMLPLNTVDDIPLVELGRRRHKGLYPAIKPAMEKVLASVALAVTSPMLLAAMLAAKVSSKGPAIFKQERVGRGGHPFTLYKVRTMVENAEGETGPALSSETDDRVTLVGRFLRSSKLDELPQLINVIKGDMSLIGPRPERPCFVCDFEQRISCYKERHRVRPGMTGLAQVYGDYSTTPETKLRYDLMYVYNQSFWLDLRIVFWTIKSIGKELIPRPPVDNSSPRFTRTAGWQP